MNRPPGSAQHTADHHVLEHPDYHRALHAISEHRLAKARGDAFEETRHLRRAKRAVDAVLADLRERLP